MTRPVLLAGVCGGLLGGVAAFVAGRLFPPNPPGDQVQSPVGQSPASQSPAPPEARQVAEAFLGKLRELKYKEFIEDIKHGMTSLNDNEFEAFKKQFIESRTFPSMYGKPLGEYELVRETTLRSNLVQLVYLEKFEGGALAWVFVLYQTKHGWRLNRILWSKDLMIAFQGG